MFLRPFHQRFNDLISIGSSNLRKAVGKNLKDRKPIEIDKAAATFVTKSMSTTSSHGFIASSPTLHSLSRKWWKNHCNWNNTNISNVHLDMLFRYRTLIFMYYADCRFTHACTQINRMTSMHWKGIWHSPEGEKFHCESRSQQFVSSRDTQSRSPGFWWLRLPKFHPTQPAQH